MPALGIKTECKCINYRELKESSFYPDSFLLLKWCRRGDSNPHGFPHHSLKMVCLPVPLLQRTPMNGTKSRFGVRRPMSLSVGRRGGGPPGAGRVLVVRRGRSGCLSSSFGTPLPSSTDQPQGAHRCGSTRTLLAHGGTFTARGNGKSSPGGNWDSSGVFGGNRGGSDNRTVQVNKEGEPQLRDSPLLFW